MEVFIVSTMRSEKRIVSNAVHAARKDRLEVAAGHRERIGPHREDWEYDYARQHPGYDQVMERLQRGHLKCVNLLGNSHRSDLGAHSRAEPACEYKRRDDRANLLEHGEGQHIRQDGLGTEPDQGPAALHRQHDPDGEAGHRRQQKALGAHLVHLMDELAHLVGAAPETLEELSGEQRQFAGPHHESEYDAGSLFCYDLTRVQRVFVSQDRQWGLLFDAWGYDDKR
jgi:hypothetical protein